LLNQIVQYGLTNILNYNKAQWLKMYWGIRKDWHVCIQNLT